MPPEEDLFAFEDEQIVVKEFSIGQNARFELVEDRHINLGDGSVNISYGIHSYIRDNPGVDFPDTPTRDATLHVDVKEVAIAEKAKELFAERNEQTIDIDELETHDARLHQKSQKFDHDISAAKDWVLNSRFPVEKRMRELEQKLEKESIAERQKESLDIRIRKPKL